MDRELKKMDKKVNFTAMKDGTREDYQLLAELEKPFLSLTADRVLNELREAGNATSGKKWRAYSSFLRLHVSSMAYNQALVQCVTERI